VFWVQYAFLRVPYNAKVAASAVECQSVTVEQDLDTVQVRSSSLLVPPFILLTVLSCERQSHPSFDLICHQNG
jgi:hypothetical protein